MTQLAGVVRRTRHRAALAVKRARRPMRETPAKLRYKAWNVHVGSNPGARIRSLAHELRVEPSDVVVLNEAGGMFLELRGVFGDDWRVWRGASDHDATLMMVCRDLRVPRHQILAHSVPWIGPKAFRRHIGRGFIWADIGKGTDKHKHRAVGVHRTPGGPAGGTKTHGRNRPSWRKEDQMLETLAMRKGSRRRAFAIVGDQNCKADDTSPTSIRDLAKRIGGRVIALHTAVDHAIVRDYDGDGKRGDTMGSDHPLVTYNLRDAR